LSSFAFYDTEPAHEGDLQADRTKDALYQLETDISEGADQKNGKNFSHETALLILRAKQT